MEDASYPAQTERNLAPAGPLSQAGAGSFAFASATERDAACGRLTASGMIVVELEGIGPSARCRLGNLVDESIERELVSRGASGPGITSASDRDATLSDQLFRARHTGALGIAVVLGPLRALVGAFGALEPEDCATLRFLAGATAERPLVLFLDDSDLGTGGYIEPVALGEILGGGSENEHENRGGCTGTRTRTRTGVLREDTPVVPFEPAALARHTAGASVVEREEAWRASTLEHVAARGPQPLAVLEKLFAESYMPLANAVAGGLNDPKARTAQDEFKAAFAKSYTDAFPTFAATTKRPRMVLDVHDAASRIARLHGARSIRMLLVDGMRWDLSRLVEERLVRRLGPRAALTDELLLWSALPTTTMRQLETIARGIEALRGPSELDAEAEPPRGRTAEYV
ncbi:MAG: hypothetical protein ACREJ3_12305, partial [Polyangiaceae bacterium]